MHQCVAVFLASGNATWVAQIWGFQRAKHGFRVRPGLFRFSPGESLPPWVVLPQGALARIPKPALFSGGPAGGFGVFLSNLEPF